MRLGAFIWLNKIAIVEYKVTINVLLMFHYCDKNEYSHILFGDVIS